jgi:hypothetical protein
VTARLPISGEYPPNWDEIGDRVRAEAGHRCVRCGHRYKTGDHGKGEWSLCDERCRHGGPLGYLFAAGVEPVPNESLTAAQVAKAVARGSVPGCAGVVAQWRILTVHHLDGNKSNCEWWNLLPLCQRCHLTVQTRLNPQIPYFLEHSPWFQPYVAGFYAHKYEGKTITRAEAVERLDELLAYERLA